MLFRSNNIDTNVTELKGMKLVNVDGLSQINDSTLQKRIAEVPKAKQIIVKHIHEFVDWFMMRRNAPALKAIKEKMLELQQCPMFSNAGNNLAHSKENAEVIQQFVNSMAAKMRKQHKPGCFFIEAMNDFISAHAD